VFRKDKASATCKMRQYLVNYVLVFDGRNDSGVTAADPTSLTIDTWAAPLNTRLSLWAQVMAT
jgi:hypothetical protein